MQNIEHPVWNTCEMLYAEWMKDLKNLCSYKEYEENFKWLLKEMYFTANMVV